MFTGTNVTEKACALYWFLYPNFNLLNIVKRSSPMFSTKKCFSMIMGKDKNFKMAVVGVLVGASASTASTPVVANARGGTWPWSVFDPSGSRAAPVVVVRGRGASDGDIWRKRGGVARIRSSLERNIPAEAPKAARFDPVKGPVNSSLSSLCCGLSISGVLRGFM
jgi:hypothetical protein